MARTTIFWPLDVSYDGFIYGWTSRATVCVAGVLAVHHVSEANAILSCVYLSETYLPLEEKCGKPIVLGRCTFNRPIDSRLASVCPRPDIHPCDGCPNLFRSSPHFFYYHRHKTESMKLYASDTPCIAKSPAKATKQSFPMFSTNFDFTAPLKPRVIYNSGLTLINQWNSAYKLHCMVTENVLPLPLHHSNKSACMDDIRPWCLLSIRHNISYLGNILSNLDYAAAEHIFPFQSASTAAQQVDLRVRSCIQILGKVHSGEHRVSPSKYIEFYNTIWVVLNDMIVGFAFRAFLHQNRAILAHIITLELEDAIVMWLQRTLIWLDSWPAGLKLNTELSHFYAHSFIGVLVLWKRVFEYSFPAIHSILCLMETASFFGMSMAVSLLCDLLSLLTSHIHLCYVLSSTVYYYLLRLITSLWNLFCGKRYNVIRDRIDIWDYDIDQLLLGTILFTLGAHLFPAVSTYYLLFALLRLLLILVQASLEILLAFMNHFPLFALMLQIKDPWRLSGSIDMVRVSTTNEDNCVVIVEGQPPPLSLIFVEYVELVHHLAKHYNLLRLAHCIFTGQLIRPIPYNNKDK